MDVLRPADEGSETMGSHSRRLVWCVGLAAVCVLFGAGSASAKGLPIDSVSVVTAEPQPGRPVDVVVRFGEGFDLGDEYAWSSDELALFPTGVTDSDGWPLDRNDPGLPVQLHRVSNGVYRGSFTVADPGEYVLVSRSAFYSHEDQLRGVVVTRDYPVPLQVQVAAATTASPSAATGTSMVPVAVVAFVLVALACVAVWLWRLRSLRRGLGGEGSRQIDERVLVGDGPHRS